MWQYGWNEPATAVEIKFERMVGCGGNKFGTKGQAALCELVDLGTIAYNVQSMQCKQHYDCIEAACDALLTNVHRLPGICPHL